MKMKTLVNFYVFTLLLLPATLAQAQTTPAPITEVNMFSQGQVVFRTEDVQVWHNGTPASVIPDPWRNDQGSFTANQTVIPGNPGTVTSGFFLRVEDHSFNNSKDFITITFSINLSSGAVTVSGRDQGPADVVRPVATLTVDGSVTTAPVGAGGNFSVSGTGNIDDRTINACLSFNSGLQICTYAFGLNTDPDPVPPTPATVGALDATRDNLSDQNYVGAIKKMTEQMSAVMLYQLPIIGTFLDSKHQLETQRIFGQAAATAHRDYQPSEQVCAFATLARSTAPSKFIVDDNISVLTTILQKRDLLNANTAASWGPFSDFISRMDKYRTVYCDPNDNNGEIRAVPNMCTSAASVRRNKDVDYRKTISNKLTFDTNFTSTTRTPATQDDFQDILALANNLYDNETLTKIPDVSFPKNAGTQFILSCGGCRELMASRSLSAIRSLEYNSYAAIAAMKVPGSGLNATQLRQLMQNIGVPPADVAALVGTNPSYFAQMDIIGQKIYQDPNFYTNLYQSPANVARMKVVLQAIRLMVDRDKFEQALRREMLISGLLEMRLREEQATYENRLRLQK